MTLEEQSIRIRSDANKHILCIVSGPVHFLLQSLFGGAAVSEVMVPLP